MSLSRWLLGVLISCQSLLCAGEIVLYELSEQSQLVHSWSDVDGDYCSKGGSAEVNLRGTFVFDLALQSKDAIVGYVSEIDIEEVDGKDYSIVGSGSYLQEQLTFSPIAEPPNGTNSTLRVMINDISVTLELDTMDLTEEVFPKILLRVATQPLLRRNDCFTLGILATPFEKDASKFFRRGDVDGNAVRNMTDAIMILGHVLDGSGLVLPCADAADTNDDARVDVADSVFLLNYLFQGGELPPIPSTFCGLDPTADELDCQGQPACMSEGS